MSILDILDKSPVQYGLGAGVGLLSQFLGANSQKKFFEQMHLIRVFDKKALALQRQGRLGTYAMVLGLGDSLQDVSDAINAARAQLFAANMKEAA